MSPHILATLCFGKNRFERMHAVSRHFEIQRPSKIPLKLFSSSKILFRTLSWKCRLLSLDKQPEQTTNKPTTNNKLLSLLLTRGTFWVDYQQWSVLEFSLLFCLNQENQIKITFNSNFNVASVVDLAWVANPSIVINTMYCGIPVRHSPVYFPHLYRVVCCTA